MTRTTIMRFFKRQSNHLNSDRGFTTVELLVAGVIGVILLGVTIMIFTQQEKLLRTENTATKIRAEGRQAIKTLAKEVRMAGFGLPPSMGMTGPDPVPATASTFSYQTNIKDIRTTTIPGNPGTSPLSGSTFSVVDSDGFTVGDTVVIYNPAYGQSETGVVNGKSSGSGDTITMASTPAVTYVYAANATLITINKYNVISIYLSGTDIIKSIDGVLTTLVSDVAASTGLEFDYYSETETSSVRKIGVTVRLVDPDDATATIEFKTDALLRNTE